MPPPGCRQATASPKWTPGSTVPRPSSPPPELIQLLRNWRRTQAHHRPAAARRARDVNSDPGARPMDRPARTMLNDRQERTDPLGSVEPSGTDRPPPGRIVGTGAPAPPSCGSFGASPAGSCCSCLCSDVKDSSEIPRHDAALSDYPAEYSARPSGSSASFQRYSPVRLMCSQQSDETWAKSSPGTSIAVLERLAVEPGVEAVEGHGVGPAGVRADGGLRWRPSQTSTVCSSATVGCFTRDSSSITGVALSRTATDSIPRRSPYSAGQAPRHQ